MRLESVDAAESFPPLELSEFCVFDDWVSTESQCTVNMTERDAKGRAEAQED